jgi:hypothetical protein
MTTQELQRLLAEAAWFTRFGGPAATISVLDDGSVPWDWLPTAQEQPDPVHGDALMKLAAATGLHGQRGAAELAAARATLVSLRSIPEHVPGLAHGGHDFTIAAKGAAVYAARMAAREITVERPGFWCEAVRLFHDGYWPCGLDNERRLVVF